MSLIFISGLWCKWQKQPPEVLYKKAVFKKLQYSQVNTCVGLSFNNVAGLGVQLHYNEVPTQVFSCEYCKIFKNIYFEDLRMAASKWKFIQHINLMVLFLTFSMALHFGEMIMVNFKIVEKIFLWLNQN